MDFRLITLIAVLSSLSVFGQIDELALMGIDRDRLSEISKSENDNENKFQDDIELRNDRELEKEEFLSDQYGYTGGENFRNPPQKKFTEDPLIYFGYDYFSKKMGTFIPESSIPVPPNYRIGPEDIIDIILYGNKNKKYELEVSREGLIFLPEVGPLTVAGLSFESLQELISTTIATQFIGTQVSITLGSLRTIDVFILGAANRPGMYSISALSSVTNAIFESGGISTSGSLRNIKLKRNGKTIVNLDLYDLLLNGDTSNDSRLMQGDVIFIEPIGKTSGIRGEVNRPAIYELKEGEFLKDLLRYAGGLKPKASSSNIELLRVNQLRKSYDLMKLDLDIGQDEALSNGDVVSIFPVNDKIQNAVLVYGHTLQPGFYPWQNGMKILDLFGSPDDLLEMTDLNYVLIKRKNINTQDFSFLQVDLSKAFDDPLSKNNLNLSDQDEILFLPTLLSANLITTTLFKENDISETTDSLFTEEEWNSNSYLRKSLETDASTIQPDEESTGINKYYEYSIYNYCDIQKDFILSIIDDERVDFLLTQECRRQLIEPILNLANQKSSEKLDIVSIFGGINYPGSYPYAKNMTLLDLINAAGGTSGGIYESEIEISRINNSGKRFVSSNLISSIPDAEEKELFQMDTITVKKLSTSLRTVKVTGEVFFPGTYPISEEETLSELLIRAGGLTEFADINASVFLRKSLQKLELKRIKDAQTELRRKIVLANQSSEVGQEALSQSQIAQLSGIIDMDDSDKESLGRLVINLNEIIDGQDLDLRLEDKDSIFIPKEQQSISVIGEVFVSNTHLYDSRLDLSDYIGLSGGLTEFSDESSIYIIRADGSIISPSQMSSGFFRSSSSQLRPGDTIVVPLEIGAFSQLKAAAEITQIIYQMAIAAAAVNSF